VKLTNPTENETYDETPSKAAVEIKKTLRLLVIATVVLFVLVVAGGIYTWTVSNNNRDALCAYRADLETRIQQGEDFLIKHPEGIPTIGISAAQLKNNLDGQKHAVKAFQEVNCP
jgi:hypothetical protein